MTIANPARAAILLAKSVSGCIVFGTNRRFGWQAGSKPACRDLFLIGVKAFPAGIGIVGPTLRFPSKGSAMTYKSILVNLDIDGPIAPLSKLAMELAHRFDARLIGMSAADIQPPIADASGMGIDLDVIGIQIKQIETRLQAVQAEFEALAGSTVDIQWRGAVGGPTSSLLEQARAADLVVTRSPARTWLGNGYRHIDLGSLVLHAGRPVFVAGDNVEHLSTNRILVAWKDTREARRALADALPLLSLAAEVFVVTIDPEEDSHAKSVLADVSDYLGRHGIKARTEVIMVKSEGERLTEFARSIHADIVVSGAYGHSRLRELVFGGVTRSLLKDGGLNRFMSS